MKKGPPRASRFRPGHVPLERALSKRGLASRTEARKLILAGDVAVDGRVIRDPLREVVPERVKIVITGEEKRVTRALTLMLNKPRGVVTTRSDEQGRPTVYSLLDDVDAHLIPVGRLDLATTGLLLFTNDTKLSAWLTDPDNEVPRVYVVSVRGEVTAESEARLREGVREDGELLKADDVVVRKTSGRESHLIITLSEGKNREIRRLCKAAGHEVTKLKRVAFGGLELGDLPPGRWREVGREELEAAFPGAPATVFSA